MADLSRADQELVTEQERILDNIKAAIAIERKVYESNVVAMQRRFQDLRDETVGVRPQEGGQDTDLPMLFEQMHYQIALAGRKRQPLPNPNAPYFAHMTLQEGTKRKQILLGYSAFITSHSPQSVIDWRYAPIAKVFFQFRCGDEYELDLPGRTAVGTVVDRNIVTIVDGELVGIKQEECEFQKTEAGWIKLEAGALANLGGGQGSAIRGQAFGSGAGRQSKYLTEVAALLDQKQYDLLSEDPYIPLLVLGGAGSGKTTVAVHRVASLYFDDPKRFKPEEIMMIVPEPGLVRLGRNLFKHLRLPQVRIATFDDWINDQRKRLLKNLSKRLCCDTPAAVVRFKRHPAIFEVVQAYVAKRQAADPTWAQYPDLSRDRHDLFGDKESLMQAVAADPVNLSEKIVDQVIRHNREQHLPTTEDQYSGVDRDRLITLDGRSIDEATPDERRGSIDIEDFPILFQVLQAKQQAGLTRKTGITKYKHLIIDEAQEFALVELACLGQALSSPPSVTVAGDAAQHTDTTVEFPGWDKVMATLGVEDARQSTLQTNYRSPRPIADLSHHVLGSLAKDRPESSRAGAPVKFSTYKEFGLGIIDLIETLGDLTRREPHAAIAIIARNEGNASKIHQGIFEALDANLCLDGDFSFRPGIDVTSVHLVKGLEFDYVIVPDADNYTYGEDEGSRRALYVTMTRAMHQLWLMSIGGTSPLIAQYQDQQGAHPNNGSR